MHYCPFVAMPYRPFYVSNWWYIFHQLSYFDSFNAVSPLKNLWSLAIEEQFYIIWPVLLIAGLKWVKNRSHLPMITFGLALVSALWMAILYSPDTDPSRVYYGTDTRAFALLIGCSLAFVWPMQRLSSKSYFLLADVFYISLVLVRLRFFFYVFMQWTNLTASSIREACFYSVLMQRF